MRIIGPDIAAVQATTLAPAIRVNGCWFDDPHPVAVSDLEREKDLEFYDKGLSNRGGAAGRYVIVAQRCHSVDLIGHLEAQGGYQHLILPNEYDSSRKSTTFIGWTDPRKIDGELLWKDVFNEERSRKERIKLGSLAYSGQFNQLPVSRDTGIIQTNWLKYWSEDSLPVFDEAVIGMDTSFKGSANSDWTVMQLWYRSKADYYLIDQVRGQFDFVQALAAFTAFCDKYPEVTHRLCEQSSNGFAIMSALRTRIQGIIPVIAKDSKISRIQSVAPIFESGHVYLPKSAPWLQDYLMECRQFPLGRWDDQIDCSQMCIARLRVTSLRIHSTQTNISLWA